MKTLLQKVSADRRGATAAEFALVLPVIGTLLFGIIKFGLVYNNYLSLTSAVASAERQFAVGRTSATPYTSATAVLYSSAPTLTQGSITITASINGAACATDATCQAALATASGGVSKITATYPCDLTVMVVNFGGANCTLTAQATERVE